jgi:acetyl esterase
MPLHPQLKKMLDEVAALKLKDLSELPLDVARAQIEKGFASRTLPKSLPFIEAKDFTVTTKDGYSLKLRWYQPPTQTIDAVFIYYHGGGYVFFGMEDFDAFTRWMCTELQIPIVFVDYRLAPEYPFPTPVEDCYAGLEWVANEGKKEGLRYQHIMVGGDSAGGHAAAMVSILARDRKGPEIDFQFLLYPWADNDFSYPSYEKYGEGHFLTLKSMYFFMDHFAKNNPTEPYPCFPMKIKNLAHLPPSYIVISECDVLHDEGLAYAKRLKDAGNTVYVELAEGMIHGFSTHTYLSACYEMMLKMYGSLRAFLMTLEKK